MRIMKDPILRGRGLPDFGHKPADGFDGRLYGNVNFQVGMPTSTDPKTLTVQAEEAATIAVSQTAGAELKIEAGGESIANSPTGGEAASAMAPAVARSEGRSRTSRLAAVTRPCFLAEIILASCRGPSPLQLTGFFAQADRHDRSTDIFLRPNILLQC